MFDPRRDPVFAQHESVLNSMERVIIDLYRAHPDLTDHQVDKILNALERVYTAEIRSKSPPTLRFTPLEQQLYDELKAVCDAWLQRIDLATANKGRKYPFELDSSKTVEDIITCLKRLMRSIKLWTKEYGMRGYLNYIKDYLPE